MAQQASGSASQILIQIEDDWGYVSETKNAHFLSANYGESIASQSAELQSNAISPIRGVTNTRNGQVTISGSIPFELPVAGCDLLYYMLMGAYTQTKDSTTGLFKKVFIRNKTLPSFTIEKGFTDINQYFQYLGCKINTMQLTVAPDALTTGSFEIQGRSTTNSTTSIDENFTQLTHNPFSGIDGEVLEGSDSAQYTNFTLNVNNTINDQRIIGSDKSASLNAGKAEVTGTVTVMFEDVNMYNKWLNEVQTNIKLTFKDSSSDSYVEFNFPRVKFNGDSSPKIENENGITQVLNYRAIVDETAKSDVVITVLNSVDLDAIVNATANAKAAAAAAASTTTNSTTTDSTDSTTTTTGSGN